MKQDVSNEILGAFVDDELACADKQTIASEIKTNPEMADRAQAMVDLKSALKKAYPETIKSDTITATKKQQMFWPAIAASITLVFGVVMGVGYSSNQPAYQQAVSDNSSLFGIKLQPVAKQDNRVLLHVSSSELDKLDFLLTKTERMLRDSKTSGYDLNIEVIANSAGVNLLRKATTPYEKRIIELQQQYANLQFIACKNTIKRLKKNGQNVNILDGVKTDRPALDTIVNRMDKGWTYVKI